MRWVARKEVVQGWRDHGTRIRISRLLCNTRKTKDGDASRLDIGAAFSARVEPVTVVGWL
jgi:hypothetical protein